MSLTNLYQLEDARRKRTHLRKIAAVSENVKELREINHHVGDAIISLTKYDRYSSVKRILEDLFVLHQDIRRAIVNKEEVLERLENEKE